MALVAGDIRIEVRISGAFAPPDGALNVWHAHVVPAALAVNSQVVVDAMRDFYTAIADRYPSGNVIFTVGSRVIHLGVTPNVLLGVTPRVVNASGTNVDVLPLQTALTVKLKGAGLVRRQQGRIYLPAPLETESTGAGAPTAAFLSDVNTAYGLFLINAAFSATQYPAVYSRADNVLYPVIAGGPSSSWSVLRSRRS